ncbi:hypothetical protein BUE80_DR000246 [Diplocarpon rosae]|nr:hypothetical protein BUE80_DR000246 [Diplocarpon rosae]
MIGHEAMSMSIPVAPSNISPRQSSPEEFELDIDDEARREGQCHQDLTSTNPTSQQPRDPTSLQKRRRVTRACDECRRKVGRLDSSPMRLAPTMPSNRRRNPAPQYIEALETRLQRAETLLRSLLPPNVDLNDPNIDAIVQQRRHAAAWQKETQAAHTESSGNRSDAAEQGAQLRSMIESTGQLDLDESGHWDFHGGSSGTVFVRRMREQFGGLLRGNDRSAPLFPSTPRPAASLSIESLGSMTESPLESGLPNTVDLPSREIARAICEDSLSCACGLLRFLHVPSFYEMFDRIYDLSPDSFQGAENRFLPLLYTVLALGCMFHTEPGQDPNKPAPDTYKKSLDQGLKYFRAARNMMDITDCRDMTSLQAVIFMTLFLQSSSDLSTCYSYIGLALRAGLRMGLHRNLAGNFNPIERETRRRVFWVIWKLDTYVSALLGFPQMLSYDDIDQELPIEVDDESITKDGVLDMPSGDLSLVFAAGNAHTRLTSTLAKVIKYIYPTKGLEEFLQGSAKSSYVISHAKIREIEQELAQWLDKLPMTLRPGGEGSPDVLRVQQLLRLSYAHIQMMLYRPFLHYVSAKECPGRIIDERSYACGAACVSVSRNIVHITTEMKRRGLLGGAYWFTMYTTFFAIITLAYFVLENPDKAGSPEILADANNGKDALQDLAKRSQAADRCSMTLSGLFEQLPQSLRESRSTVSTQKNKRSAPLPTPPTPPAHRNLHSHREAPEPTILASRATSFPLQAPTVQAGALLRTSLDSEHFQTNTTPTPHPRQSPHELMSPPTDILPNGTPKFGSTSSMQPQYAMQPEFGLSSAVPDLGAMMFSSNDPFAYPNQPVLNPDHIKQEGMGRVSGTQAVPMYFSENGPGHAYDDLQGQLFGPLPPYLSQTQPNINMQGVMGTHMMGQNLTYATSVAPSDEVNFDGIVSGDGENWSNMLADQRFRWWQPSK